ncbi:RNA-directed DNA polymerase, eukaryota, partial [Tanacetum coccineum]
GYVSPPGPSLVLDEPCIKEHDLNLSLVGKVKEVSAIPNLPVMIVKEGFQNVKLTYLGGMWILFEFDSTTIKEKFLAHTGVGSWFTTIKQEDNSFVNDERIVWVSVEGLPIKAWTPNSFRKIASCWGSLVEWGDSEQNSLSCKHLCLKTKMDVIINDKRKIIVQGNVFWIRVKELDAWVPDFEDDNNDDLSSDEEEPKANNIDETSDVDRVSESSFMQEMDHVIDSVRVDSTRSKTGEDKSGENEPHSEDPFKIYDLLKKNNNNICNSGSEEPKYPPGFTPSFNDQEKIGDDNLQGISDSVQSLSNKIKDRKKKCGMSSLHSTYSGSQKHKVGGSILDLMDELVNVGQTMGYNMEGCLGNKAKRRWINELCHKHKINFVTLQETKAENIDLCSIKELWGNLYFDHVVGSSVGCSGGIVCVWDPNMFVKDHVSKSDYFVALMGTWIPTSTKLLIISVYAPQELSKKWYLWDYLHLIINRWDGETVIMGDFNEVRSERERFGSVFNQQGAMVFNNFISSTGLINHPLDGLMELFPHLSAICLDKNLFDHRPILLRETSIDYGPSPFRFFHSWFTMEGFDSFVENTWKSFNIGESNGLIRLKKKLHFLKIAIKAWTKEAKMKSNEKKLNIQQNLLELDKIIDQGRSNEEILCKRIMLINDLHEINSKNASELSQKAKIHWSIEGDENSKYFHGILNKRRSQLVIRGVLVDGDWISDPSKVKDEFFNHFKKQFSPPQSSRICFDYVFPTRLSSDQVEELERDVSYDEVKGAIWDCGTNKSPGPDGFSFEFYRKYWSFIDQDIFMAVKDFFMNGCFPRGCNYSFIALILKIQDAKFVKDFRPISLIESVYKIIAKILANRLCLVLPYLISDVQSAFVSNRQILDGPFILNELISWCKHKNFNGMIFKVDFEKAFDSVKWDYLDKTLKAFGFGQKWCTWIGGCLKNAMGSVLVNGNPSSEFQFFKGLKQGDPLSHFLFILIMEMLHLSFMRILNVGLYNGISLNDSFTISHLFYADDVVFVGEWNDTNIYTLLNVLKCFYLASGLKINLHKSKLMGIGVNTSVVETAANLISCSILSSPFNYLGVKVGSNMSRISSWDDVVSKVSSRLSKWKLKSLSIALFGNHGALGKPLRMYRRSNWIDIIHAIQSLNDKGDIAFKDQFKRLYTLDVRKSISVADKLGHPSIYHSFRRLPRGGIEQEILNLLCSKVDAFVLPNMDDQWSWSLEGLGVFSVKSSRNLIDDKVLPKADVPTRWINVLPIKVNVFAWKVFLDKLPTRSNLSLRGVDIPSINCPICNLAVESSSHIFFSCPVARKVWNFFCFGGSLMMQSVIHTMSGFFGSSAFVCLNN